MTDDPRLTQWNERYSTEEFIFGQEPNAFLASQQAMLRSGQAVLAVADGEGRNGVWLAKHGLNVCSVDFSPVALAKARKFAEREGVHLTTEVADVVTWNWGTERFDVVVAIFIQFATPAERSIIFSKMKTTLRPGGLAILEGYTPKQLQYRTGGPSQIENLYTAELLRDAFADMSILHLREYDNVISEGTRHSGPSALIDLVARKPGS